MPNDQPVRSEAIFLFRFYRNNVILPPSRLTERGVRAVVTICEVGMRWPCRVAA